ncbi:replication initiation protein [Spirosoma pollinicola]|uniref:Initiator Rep protein WH1 domain-containing protein n=1 Tax=Spirosoma pollinicola TaxID=2057025 RepID=A0A2K8Z2D1_9BACT|nr:replication initiation protein [Spirosoma pollinicola]AUD04027.1 hypothetical protein CWM47_20665 [Spirosoma pollinicola]
MSSKSDITSLPLPLKQILAESQKRPVKQKRSSPPVVVSSAVQLNLFEFFEQGYTPNNTKANYSVELNQAFRQQMFREPMRLLQALPKLNVLERRLYWLVLGALKNYQYLQQATPQSEPLLEQRLSFQFHRSRLRPCKDETATVNISVTDVKKTLGSLSEKRIKWVNPKGDQVSVHIFDTQYLMGEGLMVLELNPKLTEAFLKLGNDFAQFNLQKALLLKKEYSQLMYSYLSRHQWRGKWTIAIEDFRKLMDVPNQNDRKSDYKGSYDRFANIKRRMIEPAIDEIQLLGDMKITYQVQSVNRQVTHIQFTICSTAAKQVNDDDPAAKARLEKLLGVINTMSYADKLTFTAKTLQEYYPKLQPWQKDRILVERKLLDLFLRADAYVEAGYVQQEKHEAYVATSVFGRSANLSTSSTRHTAPL